jgi:hypothetical protein
VSVRYGWGVKIIRFYVEHQNNKKKIIRVKMNTGHVEILKSKTGLSEKQIMDVLDDFHINNIELLDEAVSEVNPANFPVPEAKEKADVFRRQDEIRQELSERFMSSGRGALDRFLGMKYRIHPQEIDFETQVMKEQLDEINQIVKDRGIQQETIDVIKSEYPELFEVESNYLTRELFIQGLERIPEDNPQIIRDMLNANKDIVNQALESPKDFKNIVKEMKSRFLRHEISEPLVEPEVEVDVQVEEPVVEEVDIQPIEQTQTSLFGGLALPAAMIATTLGGIGLSIGAAVAGKLLYNKIHEETTNAFAKSQEEIEKNQIEKDKQLEREQPERVKAFQTDREAARKKYGGDIRDFDMGLRWYSDDDIEEIEDIRRENQR